MSLDNSEDHYLNYISFYKKFPLICLHNFKLMKKEAIQSGGGSNSEELQLLIKKVAEQHIKKLLIE